MRLDLSPWARQGLTDDDLAAIRARLPQDAELYVSRKDHRLWTMLLIVGGERVGGGKGVTWQRAFDVTVPLSYLRCATCERKLDASGDCDHCYADRMAWEADHAAR